jgi:alanine racemase
MEILASPELLDEIKGLSNLQVEGVMSHLACSNDPICPTTIQQLRNFSLAKKMIEEAGFSITWVHLGGSLALLNNLAEVCNVVRVGKAILGIALQTTYSGGKNSATPDTRMKDFELVLRLKTKIVQIKQIKKGDHVGYADLFIADRDMVIGILPIGYNDGVDRRLSNKGKMIVAGTACPILGVVAMNVTTIDISAVENPRVGQDVIVYSQEKSDENSLDNAAIVCGTLPQDLLLHLPTMITRVLQ